MIYDARSCCVGMEVIQVYYIGIGYDTIELNKWDWAQKYRTKVTYERERRRRDAVKVAFQLRNEVCSERGGTDAEILKVGLGLCCAVFTACVV